MTTVHGNVGCTFLDQNCARQRRATQKARNRASAFRLLSLAACAVSGLMSKSAMGASGTWTGATDHSWMDANWTATPVPGTGDTASG